MKKKIFDRFTENEKWGDYFNLKNFECKVALIITVISIVISLLAKLHENFDDFIVAFQNISLYVAQALLGMIGIIIAGVAIIISTLTKEIMSRIEKHNPHSSIKSILVSFEFLAFNIGIGIFIFIILYLVLNSSSGLISPFPFYLVTSIVIYFFSFIVFYSVSLISVTIKVFNISDTYSKIGGVEKNFYIEANEIRIDYIFNSLFAKGTSKEEFIRSLIEFVQASNIENKEQVSKYLEEYYK